MLFGMDGSEVVARALIMHTATRIAPSHWPSRLPGALFAAALAIGSYFLATLPGLEVVGPLTVALIVGMIVRALIGMPAALSEGTRFSAKTVLRFGIVLLGARLNFGLIATAGPAIVLIDAVIIVVGILGITWLGTRLGVRSKLATLLAVGTSICGASAVVAASSVTRSDDEDTTLAVGLCGVLGTIGVLLYVFAAPLLGLTTSQLAVLSGSTLHEVAQVMAAAFSFGSEAGDLGTLVKLTRVVLLAPAVVILGLVSGAGGKVKYSLREPPIPWFVIGFLAVGLAGSVGWIPAWFLRTLSIASVFLMVMAMAAMGLSTPFQMVKRSGMRVIYAGMLGFAGLAGVSFVLIRLLGIS